MALIFEAFRSGDNLTYIAGCSSERVVAVVDPSNAHDILDFCRTKKVSILYILNTHGHPDHTSGNDVLHKDSGAKLMAHETERVLNIDQQIEDGATIEVGKVPINVIHTPGHTEGSLCFRVQNRLICGDTMFLAGAGNTRFGGNVTDLYKSYNDKILPLPDRLEVHPGHDYAETNLRFARTLEPDNHAIDLKLKDLKSANRNGHLVKSTIGEERKYNPFLRFKEPELIQSLVSEYPEVDATDPFEVFKLIRELRNGW